MSSPDNRICVVFSPEALPVVHSMASERICNSWNGGDMPSESDMVMLGLPESAPYLPVPKMEDVQSLAGRLVDYAADSERAVHVIKTSPLFQPDVASGLSYDRLHNAANALKMVTQLTNQIGSRQRTETNTNMPGESLVWLL